MYTPLRGIGQEIEEAAATLGAVAARQRKARDVAALTEFETGISEAVGTAAVDITSDERNHPDDYYALLGQTREKLVAERLKSLPGHLQAAGKAKAANATERMLIGVKELGAKKAFARYDQAFDTYIDQQARAYLDAETPQDQQIASNNMREKAAEYVYGVLDPETGKREGGGIYSPDMAAAKLNKVRDQMQSDALTLQAIRDPESILKADKAGQLKGLSGEAHAKLLDKAQSERNEAADWQVKVDRMAEQEKKALYAVNSSKLTDLIVAGKASMATIAQWRQQDMIGEEDHRSAVMLQRSEQRHREAQALSQAQRGAINQERQDRATAGRMIGEWYRGGMTTDQIIQAASKLNGHIDGQVTKEIVIAQRMRDSQTNQVLKDEYDTVLGETKAAFEISPMGTTDAGKRILEQVYSRWLKSFNARNTATTPGAPMGPRQAAESLRTEYEAILQVEQRDYEKVLMRTLPERFRMPMGEAFDMNAYIRSFQQLRQEENTLSREDYYLYLDGLRQILNLNERKIEKRILGQPQPTPLTPATPAPTTQAPAAPQAPMGMTTKQLENR